MNIYKMPIYVGHLTKVKEQMFLEFFLSTLFSNKQYLQYVLLAFVVSVTSIQKSSNEMFYGYFQGNILFSEIRYPSQYDHKSVHKFAYVFDLCNLLDIQDV